MKGGRLKEDGVIAQFAPVKLCYGSRNLMKNDELPKLSLARQDKRPMLVRPS